MARKSKKPAKGLDLASEAKRWGVLLVLVIISIVALMLVVTVLGPQFAFLFLLLPLACVAFVYKGVMGARGQHDTLAAVGTGTTGIGLAGALGGTCHAICMAAIGFLATFGISVFGMPLMFFEDPKFFLPFLAVGGVSLGAAGYLAWKKNC